MVGIPKPTVVAFAALQRGPILLDDAWISRRAALHDRYLDVAHVGDASRLAYLHGPETVWSEEEVAEYIRYDTEINKLEKKTAELKAKGVDTGDIEFELKLAKDKARQTMFTMAKTYIDSIKSRLAKQGITID